MTELYGKRWHQAQCIANSFWRRWLKDYLPTLQARQKGTKPLRNFSVEDLVLVVDEKMPRGSWTMGLVIEVYPAKDGNVRHVKVKTATSHYVRDIRKLCLLGQAAMTMR